MDFKKLFEEQNNFLIIGKKGSAKTTLGYLYLKFQMELGKRKAFFYNHPRPELLESLPFKVSNLTKFEELFNLTDSVILIDEAQRYFDVLNKRVNEDLKDFLALSRQNNVSVIFVAHNSYFITRGLFSYVDVKIIKEVNEEHWDLERKHMAVLYRKTRVTGKEWYFLDAEGIKGKFRFDKPSWYTEELSNSFKIRRDEDGIDIFEELRKSSEESPQDLRISADKKNGGD